MDNAARALIMAASIILGLLLLSTLVYVFRAGASLDESYDAAQNVRQLGLFNAKLEEYNRNDNTIMDIITLANRVYNTNSDVDFDSSMSVKLIIQIGTQYYAIPDEEPSVKFERNQIFKCDASGNISGDPISIYDLVNVDLDTLGISGLGESSEKLSLTKLGKKAVRDESDNIKVDSEGKPIYKNNVTIYKYVFSPKQEDGTIAYTYNTYTGRVKSMKFKADINPDWDSVE